MRSFKFRNLILKILIPVLSFVLVSCNYGFFWGLFGEDNVDERSPSLKSIDSLKPNFSSQSKLPAASKGYSFLIVTDMHFGASWGNNTEQALFNYLSERVDKFKDSDPKKIPRFMVNLGDTADGGRTSEFSDYKDFTLRLKKLMEDKIGDPDFKTYAILGNHDLYHNGAADFDDYCFPYISSYYFNLDTNGTDSFSGFGFYFVDSANGTLGKSQLESLKDKLSSDSNPKIIFSHYPIFAGAGDTASILMRIQDPIERNTILTYCKKYNVKQIYDGHIHKQIGFDFTDFRDDSIQSLRYGEAAICTIDEENNKVFTEIIDF